MSTPVEADLRWICILTSDDPPVPNACQHGGTHTPTPAGYITRQEWAKAMAKRHSQEACPSCDLYFVWRDGAGRQNLTGQPA